ncbi:uncharacterized protein EDB91DRAFT_1248578 [Suillus paluster]|uniref:uncharacterized protein n=1 Tax=Suillus paluster TaxID=48578 RepID=UPI001B8722FA|nr:uncharacterized protein EDB91DRAFT_1248578 [Suillus paluster]KAG1739821.1 hypothetical protein EDB91DRAFT_1248578 [Suillus paluster]
MSASSKQTKEDGDPSSFSPETGIESFDRAPTSRKYALVGVVCSTIISCSCIIVGGAICVSDGTSGYTGAPLSVNKEALGLTLNLLVTLCTESIGLVHSVSLRSALASENRLHFNTNLRLLTAAHGWCSPNGVFFNGVMTVLLIMSYSSSSLVIYTPVDPDRNQTPMIKLVVIALSGMWAVEILTWSSSPFDFTCRDGPQHPIDRSSFAMHAWRVCAVACLTWTWTEVQRSRQRYSSRHGKLTLASGESSFIFGSSSLHTSQLAALVTHYGGIYTWSFLFNENSGYVTLNLPGPLTLGLHCSELIASVVQNERQWRYATGEKGLDTTTNPLKTFFTNPLGLILFIVKPALHWMFGLSFTQYSYQYMVTFIFEWTEGGTMLIMFSSHIWNMCMALFIFACGCTLVARHRPRGPQPATYGHLQTLANLVDEWSSVMWWGHKADGNPYCHAGTSDQPLPKVKMDCVYAGFNAAPVHPSREMALLL